MRKSVAKPFIAKQSLWKALLMGAVLGTLLGIIVLIFSFPFCLCFKIERLVWHIIAFTFYGLYQWWVWRYPARYQRWLTWSGALVLPLYLAVWALVGGIASWKKVLLVPWLYLLSGSLVALFLVAWILPFISPRTAEKIFTLQAKIGFKIFLILGPFAGIWGAMRGMYWAREGRYQQIYVAIGLILSIIAVSVSQSTAYHFWILRPWRSDKGGKGDALAQDGYIRHGGRLAGDVGGPAVEEAGRR